MQIRVLIVDGAPVPEHWREDRRLSWFESAREGLDAALAREIDLVLVAKDATSDLILQVCRNTRAAVLLTEVDTAIPLPAELAATVAHEVNNPAAFVAVNLQALLEILDGVSGRVSSTPELDRLFSEAREIIADNLIGIDRISTVVRNLTSTKPAEVVRCAGEVPQGTRVLLVDDEAMILTAYRRMLARSCSVVTAAGGQEALELLRVDRQFDAIVCDLMMPNVDGPTLYDHVGKLAPELLSRMVFCSGGALTPRTRSFAQKIGSALLEKPIHANVLRAAIARVAMR